MLDQRVLAVTDSALTAALHPYQGSHGTRISS